MQYVVDIFPWFIDMCYRNVIKNINFLMQKMLTIVINFVVCNHVNTCRKK